MEETEIIEEEQVTTVQQEEGGPEKKYGVRKRRPAWKRMISYRWIVRNIPYFLFLALLAVVYIYNGHNADKTIRHMTRVNKDLKELQYEYKTIKSEVMFRSKQSELAKAVAPFGLKELVEPPIVLSDSVVRN